MVTNDWRHMSPLAPTHPTHALPIYTAWLAWLFVATCVVVAIQYVVFNTASGANAAAAVLLVAGVLVAAGLFAFRRNSPWLAVALVTLGALAVGTIFFWTIVMLIAALALIVLFALNALRGSSVADRPAG